MKQALKGNKLVGMNVEEDLIALNITHDCKENISDYFKDEDGAFPLESLNCLLDKSKTGTANNNVLLETRTLQALYYWMKDKQTEYPAFTKCPLISNVRESRNMCKMVKEEPKSFGCNCNC